MSEGFEVEIQRESGDGFTFSLRFQVHGGHGDLAIQMGGTSQPAPGRCYDGLDGNLLRTGRFLVLPHGSRRRSYALSRLAPETLKLLPVAHWFSLRPVTELGFRYLVVPPSPPKAQVARVQIQPATPDPRDAPGLEHVSDGALATRLNDLTERVRLLERRMAALEADRE